MSFLYYIPAVEKNDVSRELLRARGLEMALRDCLRTNDLQEDGRLSVHSVNANGPDGSSGVIIAAVPEDGSPIEVGIYHDRQTWKSCGPFWLGWPDAGVPGPEQLVRACAIASDEVRLGDGRVWNVPIIRRLAGRRTELPQTMRRDPVQGKFSLTVVEEYQWAWELAEKLWGFAFERSRAEWDEVFDWCTQVLSLNYRVGPCEVSELGLITTENFMDVLRACLDWKTVLELMKSTVGEGQKKSTPAPEPASTTPGPPDF